MCCRGTALQISFSDFSGYNCVSMKMHSKFSMLVRELFEQTCSQFFVGAIFGQATPLRIHTPHLTHLVTRKSYLLVLIVWLSLLLIVFSPSPRFSPPSPLLSLPHSLALTHSFFLSHPPPSLPPSLSCPHTLFLPFPLTLSISNNIQVS